MSRLVKCLYCGKSFDRDEEPFDMVGNRYAHVECIAKHQKTQEYKDKIHQKMKDLCGEEYSAARINKQIKQFEEDGLNVKGIYKSLIYWYDVKKNNPSQANGGIGIVPYIYNDVRKYYQAEKERKTRYAGLDDTIQEEIKERDSYQVRPCVRPKEIRPPKRLNFFHLE